MVLRNEDRFINYIDSLIHSLEKKEIAMLNQKKQIDKKQKGDKPSFDLKVTIRKKIDIAKSMKSSDSSGQSSNSKN